MLNLIFQTAKAKDPSKVNPDSRLVFDLYKKQEWFQDPFVQQIIKEVDHATVLQGFVLQTDKGMIIPPEYLSTGTKTAICMYEMSDQVFNLTQMGDNVFVYMCQLALERDVTVLTYRMLPYSLLCQLDCCKDYIPVVFTDAEDYYDKFEEWLEEIYND